MEEAMATVFDPDWRDDVFDAQSLAVPLALPELSGKSYVAVA